MVPDELASNHRELAGSAGATMDGTRWWRDWPNLQDRRSARECINCRLLQRRKTNRFPDLAVANLFVSSVSGEVRATNPQRCLRRLTSISPPEVDYPHEADIPAI